MKKIGANSKEWWTHERKKEHSLKIQTTLNSRKKRVLPDNFSDCCRQGQISYNEKKDKIIMETTPFEEWPVRLIKKQLFLKNGNTCEICSFEYTDPKTGKGPFQIHHIDGNKNNWKKFNLEIRCLNCHWMTPNFAFKGRRHTKKLKRYYQKKLQFNILKINSRSTPFWNSLYMPLRKINGIEDL